MPQRKAPKRTPGTVYTERSLLDYTVFPRDGYVLPSRCTAHAEQADGTSVVVEIEIGGGRARAREVRVRTDKEAGIGWTVLSKVPVRNIVATAVLDCLMRAIPRSEGGINLRPLGEEDADEVRQVVQGAVGYSPDQEEFTAVKR